ncbi:MAG TPA: type VI secretion system protein [Pyrinomonadaceae bacterium]|nr:type VI secretion system protein [Pyrinomonadaceae bacterium]
MFSPYWPYILLAILLLVLCTALVLYLVLRRARRRAGGPPAPQPAPAAGQVGFIQQTVSSSIGLKASFARALRTLRRHVTRRDYRYRLPWFLLVGEERSGKTTLVSDAGMNLPLGRPAEQVHGLRQGVNWFFFDRGVVLDVAGDMVLRADCETSNARGWATVSRLLQKHRPERPIDGVVLTIPADDLVAGRGLAPDQRARIEQKAVCLYRKLWQAQKQLGMSFPVYVVVTKCDQVPGFQSLCRELPPRMRDEMFGWSSPYTLETAYRPEWVGEAFQNLHRYLFQAQVEVFAEREEIGDRDSLFLLPAGMQQLRAPLQLYLDQIFKESSFHDSFFFRGLYFCGDTGEPEAAATLLPAAAEPSATDDWLEASPDPFAPPPPAAAGPLVRRPAFAKDLFEKKIFLEDMLAQPVAKARLSRNRTVLAAQVLSVAIPVVGCVGLLVTHAGLERRRDELHDLLTQEEHDLKEVRALRGERLMRPRLSDFYEGFYRPSDFEARPAPEAGAGYVEAAAPAAVYAEADAAPMRLTADPAPAAASQATRDNERRLLTAMSRVSHGRLYSLFIPTSWFSDLNNRLRDSMVIAFEHVILEGLRLELDDRTDLFLHAEPLYDQSAFYPEANALPGDRGAGAGVGGERGPSPLYDQGFSAGADATLRGFIERFGELRVNRARYEDLVRVGSGSLEELEALAVYLGHERLPDGFDTNNPLYKRALREARGRPLAARSSDAQRVVAAKVAEMVEVLYQRSFEKRSSAVSYSYVNDITQTEALLARPEYTWLATYVFDARSSFHDMTLTSGLHELRRALEGLSRESFMAAGAPARVPPLSRRQLVWDGELLRRAVSLCADYERFVAERGAYSKSLDDSLQQAALARLRANVTSLVARAQRYQPAPPPPGESARLASLAAEVRNLQAAEEPLSQLLAATDRLGLDAGLRPALAAQVSHLLDSVDSAFEAERFYSMARPRFDWWDGSKPVAPPAFGADSPDDLAAYLAVQRKRIAYLARELAAPVFAFASAQNLPARQARARLDWGEMLAELERYDNKQPGSSLGTLESFILAGMDKVEVDRCDEWDGGGEARPSRDFFIQTRNHLRRLLRRQCYELAAARSRRATELAREADVRALDNYFEIADAFNRTLAGRFPFGEGVPTAPYVEAEPSAVLAFFQLLDKKGPAAREALQRNPQLGAARVAAYEFLDQMDRVRVFFAGFLEKKTGPAIDFNLEFRVNREHEVGGAQIADWTLDVGRTKYRYLDKELTGRWVFGEPVRLTLRWANNSPVVPYAAPETAHFRARDRVAVFEYKNRWSLLTMLLRQQPSAADFAPYDVDQDVYSLRFNIPTRAGGNLYDKQPEPLRAEEARVFMRLSLLAPGAKDPLELPRFPAGAPRL